MPKIDLSRISRLAGSFDPLVFAIASLIAAVVLVAIVAIPQYVSKQARWDVLLGHVREVGQIAASVVDGDLHRQLLDPANYSDELYARALRPLVRLHSADPDIFYVYTMVDRGGVPHFVLDTAASPELQTQHELRASDYMETFKLDEDDDGDWLRQIASGQTYISPDFEEDDYGTFLTAHVPIYDSQGRYSGFVGVDFDTQYYLTREASFRAIAIFSAGGAVLIALVIGYFAARYHATTRARMQELHERSIRDSLTGFYNRRGVTEVVKTALETYVGTSAVVLVDINNLTMINDMRGRVIGDAVVARASEAIRQNMREGYQCGRLGNQFVIFARDCDKKGAAEMAERILSILPEEGMSLASVPVTVLIGIAVDDGVGDADFARMVGEAEAALRQAKLEGRSRIGIAPPPSPKGQPARRRKAPA